MRKLYYLFTLIALTLAFNANGQNCQALFQHSVLQGTTVQFTDSSFSNTPMGNYLVSWDFGDGTYDTLSRIPAHTYANSGTYVACLTITTFMGCVSTYCDSITVGGTTTSPLSCSYTYFTDTLNNAYFNSNVSGGTLPYSYSWNFGNGSTSTNANPSVLYTTPGAYGVSMTITDANGQSCTSYDTVYVNYCQAYFIATTNSGSGTVSFANYSAVSAFGVSFDWNFGDGNTITGVRNPSHTYTSSGTYTVTLTANDSLNGCMSSYTDSVVINLNSNPPVCQASFTVAKDSSAPYKVILYNTSSMASSHFYQWNFGDGTTGSGRTPQHQYQNFGSYLVCLTITDNLLNCTSTFCDTVGMDSLGNLKSAAGFGIEVRNPTTVSLEEESNIDMIEFYPNPATSEVNIQFPALNENINLTIRDLSGKEVYNIVSISEPYLSIDINELESGFYFMIFNDGKTQRIEKLVVSR